ncbi:MAG: 3-keto-5-aminohexanoate cleavage protein [Actinobacteria bacterium]|nr:3-keto-5-aminohexanoate cleavage protein [Actinomycetota bacterium]
MAKSAIVTCAITGGVHTPTMSPYLPVTPEEIAEHAAGAVEAGAAIIHLHARDPKDGRPTPDPTVFGEFIPAIKERTGAIINITTGGGLGMTLDERLAASLKFSPEVASLNMGSINFGIFPVLDHIKEFKYSWEAQYLESSRDFVYKNTFTDIERVLRELGEVHGTRFELEVYDLGQLYNVAHFVERGLITPPFFIQFVFGILGGMGAEVDHLIHLRATAERLFGDSFEWSVLAAGRHQMPMVTTAACAGGNVRVGLEDSLYVSKGELARTNGEQVQKIVRILGELSIDVATVDEVRQRLALKGEDAVNF